MVVIMNKIINPVKAKFGGSVLLVIIIAEAVIELVFKQAAWPAFLCMIFFMLMGESKDEFLKILLGGLFGIALLFVSPLFVKALLPAVGAFPAELLWVLLFVTCIILFTDVLPLVFNTYAFMFMLVASLAVNLPNPTILNWMVVELIGGAAIMGALYFLSQKIVHEPAAKAADAVK